MPDALASALAAPGLIWLMFTIGVAGIVRGFTGFGTALIVVPVAGLFLPPADIIVIITLTGVASSSALLPKAWPVADRRDVGILVLGAAITAPLGIWLLQSLDEVTMRWIAAVIAGGTLLALLSGWRYKGTVSSGGLGAIGLGAGLAGGMTGLTGPVVILFYLVGKARAEVVRANTILFLALTDVVVIANLLWAGLVRSETVWIAIILSIPYFITSLIGQRLFDPRREAVYRWGAYTVIALAVARGLPIWG